MFSMISGFSLHRARALGPLVVLLVVFNLGSESLRQPGRLKQLARENPGFFLSPPTNAVRAYVSRDSDANLYHAYTQLLFGEQPDVTLIAHKRALPVEALRIRDTAGPRVPHRDFSIEYPPGAWLAILPPALLSGSLEQFHLLFGLWMSLFCVMSVWIALSLRSAALGSEDFRPGARLAFWWVLAIGPLSVNRFDFWPALITLVAVERAYARRWGWSGFAIGLGIATKVYPAILLPVLSVVAWNIYPPKERVRTLARLCAATALGVVVVAAPIALMAGPDMLRDLSSHLQRPLEIESVLGTPLLFAPDSFVYRAFGSSNLGGPGVEALSMLSLPLSVVACVCSCVLAYRLSKRNPDQAIVDGCLWALLASLCCAKVFSPQYLLWLFPLGLASPGSYRRPIVLALIACSLLTQIWYPTLWQRVLALAPEAISLIAVRNVALVTLTLALAVHLWRVGARVGSAASDPESSDPVDDAAAVPTMA